MPTRKGTTDLSLLRPGEPHRAAALLKGLKVGILLDSLYALLLNPGEFVPDGVVHGCEFIRSPKTGATLVVGKGPQPFLEVRADGTILVVTPIEIPGFAVSPLRKALKKYAQVVKTNWRLISVERSVKYFRGRHAEFVMEREFMHADADE